MRSIGCIEVHAVSVIQLRSTKEIFGVIDRLSKIVYLILSNRYAILAKKKCKLR